MQQEIARFPLSAQEKYCDTACIFWEFPSGAQGFVVVYKHVHHCAQGFVAVYNLHTLVHLAFSCWVYFGHVKIELKTKNSSRAKNKVPQLHWSLFLPKQHA